MGRLRNADDSDDESATWNGKIAQIVLFSNDFREFYTTALMILSIVVKFCDILI